ncbi:MAG: oligosaccharide flippase family protein, partial [Selenomonadaceae bacterium]|nr:oligosaccharide flippase family protein [Selenomonadaceae bacterium]
MTDSDNRAGEKFLKGTFILTIASFVVKVIGSLNWIFVSRILGGEGIGLYQMAFPIYFFAMTVSQAGVPVAISIITAERVALNDIYGAKRVFRISMALMLLTGILFSVLTYFAASWLIEWQFIRDPRAYMSVVVLAPTVFFVTFLASSRGYLQGWQRMTPTAVSQIVEQIFRVITMIVLADLFLPWGLEYAAAGASLGALAAAVTGLIVLVYFHIKLNREIDL